MGAGRCFHPNITGSNTQDPLVGGGTYGLATTTLQAEAISCSHAMEWVVAEHCTNVMFLTYSTNLICLLQGQMIPPIHLQGTISRIRELGVKFNWCMITKVPRDVVATAGYIAKRCLAILTKFDTI